MNKTTLILLLAFVAIGGLAFWYINQGEAQQLSTISLEERKFNVDSPEEIHKVFIAKRSGETTTLVKEKGEWLYNGQYQVLPNAIDNLMRAFEEMEIKYKPADAAVPNMIKNLAAYGIKVELYNKANEKIQSYYVGGATPDERGTFMIKEDADQPYVVHIPTWEGNLRFRFNLSGDQWKDKTVISKSVEDITQVTIEYPKQQNESFVLTKSNGQYEVKPFYDFSPIIQKSVNQGRAEQFLAGFEKLIAEAFENGNPRQDSILQTIPFCRISIQDKTGNTSTYQFFPIQYESALEDKSGNATSLAQINVDRYFLDANGQNFMLVQNRLFSKVFWGYNFFF